MHVALFKSTTNIRYNSDTYSKLLIFLRIRNGSSLNFLPVESSIEYQSYQFSVNTKISITKAQHTAPGLNRAKRLERQSIQLYVCDTTHRDVNLICLYFYQVKK